MRTLKCKHTARTDLVTMLLDHADVAYALAQETLAALDLPDEAALPAGIAAFINYLVRTAEELAYLARTLLDTLSRTPTVTFYGVIGHDDNYS